MYFSSGAKLSNLNCGIYFLTIIYIFVKKQINNDFSNALTYIKVTKQKIFSSCMKLFYIMRNSLCNNNGYVDIYSSPVAYQLLKLYVIHCLHLNLSSTEYHDMFSSLLKGFSLLYFLYSLMFTY